MGLSILGALLALSFALLGQSPGLVQKLGLGGARLDLKVRTFTSYAFALLLLSIGFFLAGFPVETNENDGEGTSEIASAGDGTLTASVQGSTASSTEVLADAFQTPEEEGSDMQEPVIDEDATPATGSFDGPPPVSPDLSPESGVSLDEGDTAASGEVDEEDAAQPGSTSTPRPSPTPTTQASPTPTATPRPTITPTPITGETALVSSGGSTIWIVRSPGGQNVTLVRDGDTLLLLPGHANEAGLLWREVRTVNGVLGWIQEIFLEYPE